MLWTQFPVKKSYGVQLVMSLHWLRLWLGAKYLVSNILGLNEWTHLFWGHVRRRGNCWRSISRAFTWKYHILVALSLHIFLCDVINGTWTLALLIIGKTYYLYRGCSGSYSTSDPTISISVGSLNLRLAIGWPGWSHLWSSGSNHSSPTKIHIRHSARHST